MLVKKKSNHGLKIVRGLVPLLVVIFAIYIIFFTPIFVIQAIEINGSGAPAEEINAYIGEDAVGSNIIFWNPKRAVEEQGNDITKKLAAFQIRKSYFKRQIIINISERDKKLIWCYEAIGECFWADDDGILFDSAPKTSGNLIYSVHDGTSKEPEIGARVIDEAFWINLNKIFSILSYLNVSVESATIENIKFRELVVATANGPKIVFGLNIDPDFAKTALSSLQKAGWEKIRTINLTVHGRAYTSF